MEKIIKIVYAEKQLIALCDDNSIWISNPFGDKTWRKIEMKVEL